MNDLRDFRFDSKSAADDFETGPVQPTGPPEGGRAIDWRVVAWMAFGIVLIAALVYWFMRPSSDKPTEPEAAADSETAPAVVEPPSAESEPAIDLPELGASDLIAREMVGALSAHPRIAAWLATDDLIRRFTAAIVNIAEGATPKSHLGMMGPTGPFTTTRTRGVPHPSNESYARYDSVAEAFAGLDVPGTVKLYDQLKPLLDEAFLELGYPGEDFHRMLVTALDHLLATPAIEGEVVLEETVAAFKFADPDLEALSAAQKQLLRMGPENARRVQTKLGALRRALLAGGGN